MRGNRKEPRAYGLVRAYVLLVFGGLSLPLYVAAGEATRRSALERKSALEKVRRVHGGLLLSSFPEAQYLLRGPQYLKEVDSGDEYVDKRAYQERLARSTRILRKECDFAPESALELLATNRVWNGMLFFGSTRRWGVVAGYMRLAEGRAQVLRERKIAILRDREGVPALPKDTGALHVASGSEDQPLTNLAGEDLDPALAFLKSILEQWGNERGSVQRLVWDPVAAVWNADCRFPPLKNDKWETTIYNMSWDRRGGITVRIVEILRDEFGFGMPGILESYEKTGWSAKPEVPLTFRMPARRAKTVRFWPW